MATLKEGEVLGGWQGSVQDRNLRVSQEFERDRARLDDDQRSIDRSLRWRASF